MNKIPAAKIDGQWVICKMLDAPDDLRPDWLLECEGKCLEVKGHRVWVRFYHSYYAPGTRDFLMSWRELEPKEAGT